MRILFSNILIYAKPSPVQYDYPQKAEITFFPPIKYGAIVVVTIILRESLASMRL